MTRENTNLAPDSSEREIACSERSEGKHGKKLAYSACKNTSYQGRTRRTIHIALVEGPAGSTRIERLINGGLEKRRRRSTAVTTST